MFLIIQNNFSCIYSDPKFMYDANLIKISLSGLGARAGNRQTDRQTYKHFLKTTFLDSEDPK